MENSTPTFSPSNSQVSKTKSTCSDSTIIIMQQSEQRKNLLYGIETSKPEFSNGLVNQRQKLQTFTDKRPELHD